VRVVRGPAVPVLRPLVWGAIVNAQYVVTRAQSARGNRYEVPSYGRRPGIGRRPRPTHIAKSGAMRALCGVMVSPWPAADMRPETAATCRRCGRLYSGLQNAETE
jgi:hypothetical protein